MRKKRRWILILPILLLLILMLQVFMKKRIDPLIAELACAEVSDLATNVINDAVDEQIASGQIQYQNFVTLVRNQNGQIAALTTNMQEMNRLKTQLLGILETKIHEKLTDQITIPLGNITGIRLLSGRGPGIPVKIVSLASSDAAFRGAFEDAGINQTVHRIMMDVTMDLVILLPNQTITQTVSTDVCVAETVLIGTVPTHFTYFNTAGNLLEFPWNRGNTNDDSTGNP